MHNAALFTADLEITAKLHRVHSLTAQPVRGLSLTRLSKCVMPSLTTDGDQYALYWSRNGKASRGGSSEVYDLFNEAIRFRAWFEDILDRHTRPKVQCLSLNLHAAALPSIIHTEVGAR